MKKMKMMTRGIGTLLAASLILVSGFVLADVTIPNTFSPGTPIKSGDVNANFAALNTGKQDKVVTFTHIASAANSSQNYTFIDNAATNGNPNAFVIVTPNRSPPGGTTQFYYGSISISYSGTGASGKWTILHDKGPTEPIVVGEAFNVLVVK
jgi:hypothetical protein